MANKLGLFLAGGLVGAGIALLYAPRSGAETRQLVAEQANAAWGQAQDLGGQVAAKGQVIYGEAAAKGQAVCADAAAGVQAVYTQASAKGKEVYQGAAQRATNVANAVKPVFAEKNDELREKIDAARERIAAQVVKNAEAAHAAVSEKVPVAAGKVTEAADAIQERIAAVKAADKAADAIEDKVEDVADAVEDAVEAARDEAK